MCELRKLMMFDEIKIIILKVVDLKDKAITPETRFIEDLGADYLDMVEIGMGIEDKFNIEILIDRSFVYIRTVADMIKAVKEHAEKE